jgi:hypothetical protein
MNGKEALEPFASTSEYARCMLANFHHFVALGPLFHWGCGSYLFDGRTYAYEPRMFKKQEALFKVGQTATNVLEIGVYLGHSLLILLLSNPTLRITCIDNDPTFTPAAVAYLNAQFGDRVTLLMGDSREILTTQELGSFDCIHIDADHRPEAVQREFDLSRPFARPGARIVFDDYEAIRPVVDKLVGEGTLVSLETPWCAWTNTITALKSESS